ncbi:MAG TPA: amino acid ABC transporter substrate-binding protein [Stellaceae bacterium]|nr:amino acid ABC transporter substrate-binding protein [Stellaceae bacterium]
MRSLLGTLALAALTALGAVDAAAGTVDDIRQRGVLRCGIRVDAPGFAFTDDKGVARGFDVEFCHALAAAVLGDPAKIETQPLLVRDAIVQLRNGAVDVLTHGLTWNYSRDNGGGVTFVGVWFYDGQGFMVRRSSGITSATQLNGASICIIEGSSGELTIGDYFRAHNMQYQVVVFADVAESRRAYDEGRCDAWSSDKGNLAARGLALRKREDHVILPEMIMRDPLGPVVRKDDAQWFDIVRWTRYALIEAEDLGITQANIEDMRRSSGNPEVQRLLGVTDELGAKNNLSKDWAYNTIKAVGNYGEIYDRYLGPSTKLDLDRGPNRLWKDGGLLYAPPFR